MEHANADVIEWLEYPIKKEEPAPTTVMPQN
jgi:hypothetical protein